MPRVTNALLARSVCASPQERLDPLHDLVAADRRARRDADLGQPRDLPAPADRAQRSGRALERRLDVGLAVRPRRQLDAQILAASERERARRDAGAQVVVGDDPRRHRADLVDELAQRVANFVFDHERASIVTPRRTSAEPGRSISVVEIIVVGCA